MSAMTAILSVILYGSPGRLFVTLLICEGQGSRALPFGISKIQCIHEVLLTKRESSLQEASSSRLLQE